MYSLRRVALRSAVSASRAIATKPQLPAIAQLIARPTTLSQSRSLPAVRCFSQTLLRAEEGEQQQQGEEPSANKEIEGEPTPYGVFIRNMVFDATENHLLEAFTKYGPVKSAAIARDARGLSRGYGFVWFEEEDSVSKAINQADGSFWHGRRIAVSRRAKIPKQTRTPVGATNSLYIGNIPYETTDAELNKLFRSLENCVDVRVAVDRTTGWPRGFAHADFANLESAKKAWDYLQGYKIGGRELRVDYASGRNSKSTGSSPDTSPNPPETLAD